ncbi:hypothetical protein [Mycolicibacterium vanbaalenii]|uniref:Uncharacterized protein n=1 Tax=Mycolicibacterium vanbaalenii (strain DSM 7251 / JCM 13017 / BCRC 16820 / KCTC 9966 / NRRL B-24157 / PYR-1) TaxID=350058 RepID=A1TDI7_MYCVP|nr:hypothetical protein [Mycolicibacterium vanbaalenii]ABM15237.1 hypothetical protein Mvan_4462 [Mycolicibacterium vanbaalenii PYR-1]MCV7128071.1 hypothetical protein [Mycolicibacterium vanbaalenii PYR-1]
MSDRAQPSTPPPQRQDGSRSRWTHPLTLAIIPAVASVIVGIFAIFPRPDPAPPDESSSAAATHEDGISFRLEPDLEEYSGGWQVVFDGPLPSTDDYPPGKPRYADVYSWAKTRGAIDVDESHLRLLLQNDGAERVTIRSINAVVTSRKAPLLTTYVMSPGAGTNEIVALGFNLDDGDLVSAQPDVEPKSAEAEADLPFFSTKNITLDPGESTDVKITTRTTECLCLYKFEIEVVKPDSTATLEIGDESGGPLAISAHVPRYANRYENGMLACGEYGLFYVEATSSGRMADCSRPA